MAGDLAAHLRAICTALPEVSERLSNVPGRRPGPAGGPPRRLMTDIPVLSGDLPRSTMGAGSGGEEGS